MGMRLAGTGTARTALVLIPGSINYFYNLNGRRIAEALGELGFAVDVRTLTECPERDYDCCILVNVTEVLLSFGDQDAGLEKLRTLRRRCRSLTSCSLDCVATHWYERLCELCRAAEVDTILDLGLCDQRKHLSENQRPLYHFVASGLIPSERQALAALETADEERPIPWAFVGHFTPHRAALVDLLVRAVDPRGFVYLPALAPYTEQGSPHLNQGQYEAVLRRTRFQLWCSHHHHFYMEPERFRTSLLTGGVPVKVVESKAGLAESAPFRYLVVHEDDLRTWLRAGAFDRVRRRFRDDFRRMKNLEHGLADFLVKVGVLAPTETSIAEPAHARAG